MIRPAHAARTLDRTLAEIAEDLTRRIQSGEPVDAAAIAARHPEHAEDVRRLIPALVRLAELGRSAGPDAVAAAPGATFAGYRVIRELGRGGMGVVFEAVEPGSGRRVALKVLPDAAADDPRRLARFRVEAQAAALLDHPHIVPIFAVGGEGGAPHYAMQLIDGPSLADLIRGAGGLGDDARTGPTDVLGVIPANPPDFPRAARLIAQAAEALDYAHEQGVLHRDVKPANLLLGRDDHLWVVDFGVARLLGDPGPTRTGDLVGTLRYMSPEQARGGRAAVDRRADVYSLGVTLYELVTLRPALAGDDRRDLLRAVAEAEPTPPRRVDPAIPVDLETIILKSIAKVPDGRYPSARDLADDLRRFSCGLPILARRPTPAERAARWASRHRRATAAAAITLLAATAGCAIGAAILWNGERRTREALHATEVARRGEREALRFTFAASDRVTARALARIASTPQPPGPDTDFCRAALGYYEDVSRRYRGDPEMRPILAAAEHRIGFIRMILGMDGAEAAFRRSIALYEALAAGSPGPPGPRRELAFALGDYAMFLRSGRGFAASEDVQRRSLAIEQALVDESPGPGDLLICLGYHQLEFAAQLAAAGRPGEADRARDAFLDRCTPALAARPDDSFLANLAAWVLSVRPGRPADADRAVLLARRAVGREPKPSYCNTLGLALYRAGDWPGSVEAIGRSMRLGTGGDAFDWLILAMAAHRQGRSAEARTWLDRAAGAVDERDAVLVGLRAEARATLSVEAAPR